ncbi:MAG: rod shape-determining protein MreC [Chitinophagia bacterium]|nr:rod shape-determining protein MreC [Chitinophagia bacterium]
MRNFILLIRRFFNLILFIGLEIIAFMLVSRSHTLQGDDIVSAASAVTGLVYQKQSDLVYYINLGTVNDSLLSENIRLRKLVDRYTTVDTLADYPVKRQLAGNGDTSQHIVKYADYIYRTARVINNSVENVNNYITINRGTADGIRQGMAVISGTGLVGRVEHASSHFAVILSIMSAKQQVSARLRDGSFKSTIWDNERPEVFQMRDMPPEAKVHKGDSVFTTSYGNTFPPDVLIGTVTGVEWNKKNGKQHLYLKPATNFRALQYVYVLQNVMETEKKQLEDSTIKQGK